MRDHLPWSTKNWKLSYLWVCPECGTINAWDWGEAERALKKLRAKGLKVDKIAVSTGSFSDNTCGHCHSDIVQPDSPILAECYTHIEQ
jgi:hypothetical protein